MTKQHNPTAVKDLIAQYKEKLGIDCELEFIHPQFILNDRRNYQRMLDEKRIAHKMEHYDVNNPSVALVAKRVVDGNYFAIDGQHHTEAAVRLGVTQVPILTFRSHGVLREREVFDKLQRLQLEEGK